MIEVIKASFAAGETKTFLINGGYFEVIECAYPIDVLLMDKQGSQRSILKNAEASYFNAPGAFEVVQITSANAQDVRFFVGDGTAGTRRVAGVVSVVDGGKNRTIANVAGVGNIYVGSAAGLISHTQIWNPAGSGKNIFIEQILAAWTTGTTFAQVRASNAALGTAAANSPQSKNIGAAPGVAQFWTTQNAALQGTASLVVLQNGNIYEPREPFAMAPGTGVIVSRAAANEDISAGFEWFEETI